jgi:hypothetical protein
MRPERPIFMEAVFVRRSGDLIRRRWIARKVGAWKQEAHLPTKAEDAKAPAATRPDSKGKRRR